MKRLTLIAVSTLYLALRAHAEDKTAALPPPVESAAKAPETTKAPEAAPVKPEAPAVAIATAAATTTTKAEAPELKKPEAAPPKAAQMPKALSPEERLAAEWNYLKDAAIDTANGLSPAAADDIAVFIRRHPDAPMADEAEMLLASLYRKQGDRKAAMVALLKLLYEYPNSKIALRAQSDLLDLGNKELAKKLRPALGELVKGSDSPDKAERLALMLQRIVSGLEDALYEPTLEEFRRFEVRFPDYPKADAIQLSLAQLHQKGAKHPAALLAYRELLAVYPDSALCPQTQFALGGLYADDLGDYKKAIDTYQELVEKYPDSADVLAALERTARLFADKLRQYELAVQIDERIIKSFPKTEGALKAFKDEAWLFQDHLSKPDEAIKAYRRLTEQFTPPAAVEALRDAAQIARKDLKDYKLEIELRAKIASDYPAEKGAPDELYKAAEIYEGDLHDQDSAIKTYKEVAAKFPDTKLARKAQSRIDKLEKN